MVDISENIINAGQAKLAASSDLELAKKLYKEHNYYDWVIVILFYSSCLLITSICFIKNETIPKNYKGRYDKATKIYKEGLLDRAKKYLSSKSYESYSILLVQSQLLRYNPDYKLKFQEDSESLKLVSKLFSDFRIILEDFKEKYNKYLK